MVITRCAQILLSGFPINISLHDIVRDLMTTLELNCTFEMEPELHAKSIGGADFKPMRCNEEFRSLVNAHIEVGVFTIKVKVEIVPMKLSEKIVFMA